MRQRHQSGGVARKAARTLVLGVSVGALGACDSLLEVELPHILTDDAITQVTSAQIQVNSIQALFECGISAFSWVAMGHEDIYEAVAGVAGTVHVFRTDPVGGTCDTSQAAQAWFDQLMGARQMVSTDPAKLGNYGGSAAVPGVYDQLVGGWIPQLPGVGERLAAISSIYMAASLANFGQFYCEGALDQSQMITASQFLALAEDWITTRALGHITAAGTFAMPNGSTTGSGASPTNAALALRAQIRLGRGDLAGANADAATVLASSPAFTFNATRESGAQRRNKVYDSGTAGSPFSGMLGVNTFWGGAARNPNPATGQTWPATIPFTGYIFLGIHPDGRTLEADNTPVRWAQELRTAPPANAPVSLANGSAQDPRVPHIFKSIQGPAPREVTNKFTAVENDIPLVTWRELTLIRARFENEVNNNRAAAIALINGMRGTGVPDISGAYLTALTNGTDDASIVGATDQQEMKMVILEEARREFYGGESGRWWQWKIQNTDLMWFPRFQGFTASGVYRLQGGVRLNWPEDEYLRNPLFPAGGVDNKGAGCTAVGAGLPFDTSERPVNS